MSNRRMFIRGAAVVAAAVVMPRLAAAATETTNARKASRVADRFPHFQSTPVSYRSVKMLDTVWAPRQKTTRDVTVGWIAKAHDSSGGIEAFKAHPTGYVAGDNVLNMEAIKCIEAMATVVGLQRDAALEGFIDVWAKRIVQAQGADGYLLENFPPGIDRTPSRWNPTYWSHEDYTIGHFIEAAIAYREATGDEFMYHSALRAADNMAAALLPGLRPYTSGHPEIEQALLRLYDVNGDEKFLQLCGWLLDQRGNHAGRESYGRMRLDDIPIKQQRAIQGHAVMAAYLYNAATNYVGATGDAAYRETVLSVWDDLVDHRMYIHGGGGTQSAKIEGYRRNPDCILPGDSYCESCSVWANFQWAHSLFRLTGDAKYIDTAERMLYNAFYASLSLKGDSSFYTNLVQTDEAQPRSSKLAGSCCPPNIAKLFASVGGYFYSTDADGIFVKHYGASEALIPAGREVRLTQKTNYPWDGCITLFVDPHSPSTFSVHLRSPAWAKTHKLWVNGTETKTSTANGWITLRRRWKSGDRIEVDFPMEVERITLPARFKEYENRAALQRGPVVYCLEGQDLEIDSARASLAAAGWPTLATLYIPEGATFTAEHRADMLGGVTVLHGEVRQLKFSDEGEYTWRAMFVPYGVWGNREPGPMRIWLGARKVPLVEMLLPEQKLGESCIG